LVRHGLLLKEVLMKGKELTEVGPVTNGGKEIIESSMPYVVKVTIKGTADLLFHAWNCEAVDAKSRAKKGSETKKTDNIESYVYRDEQGHICLPGEYLRGALINAAKFRQDPRSPRKSAMDLYKAGIISLSPLAKVGPNPTKNWDFLHQCRVQINRNSITRTRPAFKAGWEAELTFLCNLPEYIPESDLHEVISQAGRLIGVGDFRPTYGRFLVTSFKREVYK
jgi:hypothetical protein